MRLRRFLHTFVSLAAGLSILPIVPARATDLFHPESYASLVSDRRASRVGDALTIIINETASASNSATNTTAKATTLGGQISGIFNKSLQLGLNNNFSGSGQTARTGRMVAELSVVVDQVLPNGDIHVRGDEFLNINGEKTKIKLSGRVRAADISSNNTVQSTALADAVIDYDGKGFVAQSARPGVITRIFNWLGLW